MANISKQVCKFDTVKLISIKQDAECCGINFDFMKIIQSFLSLFPYYSRSQLTITWYAFLGTHVNGTYKTVPHVYRKATLI